MSHLPSRDEVFWKEAFERQQLYDALRDGASMSAIHECQENWWSSVETVFAYLVRASALGSQLQPIDWEFFAVMQGLAGDVRAGRLPDVFDIARQQGDPATAHERLAIGNAVLYLLAAEDPVSPISNKKPRKIVADRFSVSKRTVSNWKSNADTYLANRARDPETLRSDWLRIIVDMKVSGKTYTANKLRGKRRKGEGETPI